MKMRFSLLSLLCGAALCLAVFARASTRGGAPKVAVPNIAPQNAATGKPYRVTRRATLHDARINESSGLCRSLRYENLLWTHNDSGDAARMFLLDKSGDTRAIVHLEGARNIDWEDSASGPKEVSGGAWIYVGDIGDNEAKRQSIKIYRFREPQLPIASTRTRQNGANISKESPTASRVLAARANATIAKRNWNRNRNSEQKVNADANRNLNAKNAINADAPQLRVSCEAMTLRYPGGAHDAETLLVAPDNRILLVTKSLSGSEVFLAPQSFRNGASQTLRAVGKVQFSDGGFFGFLATGGDISADGTRVAIRTYTRVYQWKRDPKNNSEAAWRALFRRAPESFAAPEMAQSESACYDTRGRLFLSSEKLPAPLVMMER